MPNLTFKQNLNTVLLPQHGMIIIMSRWKQVKRNQSFSKRIHSLLLFSISHILNDNSCVLISYTLPSFPQAMSQFGRRLDSFLLQGSRTTRSSWKNLLILWVVNNVFTLSLISFWNRKDLTQSCQIKKKLNFIENPIRFLLDHSWTITWHLQRESNPEASNQIPESINQSKPRKQIRSRNENHDHIN